MRKLAVVWILSLFITSAYSQTDGKNGGPASKSGKSAKNWMDDTDSWGWDDSSDGGRAPNTINRGWDSDSWESNGDSSERGFPGKPKVAGNRISTGSDSQWDSDSWENDESSDTTLRGNGKKTKNGNGGNFDSSDGWDNDESSDNTLRGNGKKTKNGGNFDSSDGWENDESSDNTLRGNGKKTKNGGNFDSSDGWENDESSDNTLRGNGKKTKNGGNFDSSDGWENDESSERTLRTNSQKRTKKNSRDTDSSYESWYSDSDYDDFRVPKRGSKRPILKAMKIINRFGDSSDESYDSWESDFDSGNRGVKTSKSKSKPRLRNNEASSDWYSDESDNWYDSDRNGRNRGNGGGGKNGLKQNRDSDSSDWFSDESDIRGGSGSKRGNGKVNTISNRDSDNWSSDTNHLWDSDSYEQVKPPKGLKRGSRNNDDDSDENIRQNNRIIKRLKLHALSRKVLGDDSEDNTRLPAGVLFLGDDN